MLVGILSDIHSDFKSLKKAIAILEKRNCDQLVCLGDIVGYNSDYTDFSNTDRQKTAFLLYCRSARWLLWAITICLH
jgi:predicted phosphodiesterase